jgi:HCOMODA/2-hydroxy-3-carboxy-muconic semialdehyde decarboxylase
MDEQAVIDAALTELVIANRIMAREDVIDDFGHVSIRHPLNPDRYFLSRSRSPANVTRADIQEFDMDDRIQGDDPRGSYRERPIHSEVYRARPDVMAVTHHHARSVVPFTISDVPLRPIFHMGSVIGRHIPIWDSQPEFGDTNMLIETKEQGASLARTLGDGRVALMRAHGAICAAQSLKHVCMVSIYLKENADLILRTLPLTQPTYLSDGEIEKTTETLFHPSCVARAWDYWIARAGFPGL